MKELSTEIFHLKVNEGANQRRRMDDSNFTQEEKGIAIEVFLIALGTIILAALVAYCLYKCIMKIKNRTSRVI